RTLSALENLPHRPHPQGGRHGGGSPRGHVQCVGRCLWHRHIPAPCYLIEESCRWASGQGSISPLIEAFRRRYPAVTLKPANWARLPWLMLVVNEVRDRALARTPGGKGLPVSTLICALSAAATAALPPPGIRRLVSSSWARKKRTTKSG